MAPKKKKHKTLKKKQREILSRWMIYITSVAVTLVIITNLSFSAMETFNWDNSLIFSFIFPSLLKVFGVLIVIYSPWIWFTRKEISKNYYDFKKTIADFFR
jgi:hypothetical protein